ncbi:MAG: FecR domain-containing protein [Spirochaetia bacterium]|nr:FecR domain-containing protein [Spirochaetia bacterium]
MKTLSSKKIKIQILLLTGIAFFISFCSKKETTDFQGAIITHVNGLVEVSSLNNPSNFSTITPDKVYSKEGMILPGQIIKTGKDSRVDLQLKDGILFRLGPETKILLKESQILSGENFHKVEIDLSKGKMFTTVNKMEGASSFKVKTPTAIAGVRGTDFLVVSDEVSSDILVEDGSVEVLTESGDEIVDGGNKANTTEEEIKVSELTEEDKQELSEMGSDLHSINETAKTQIQEIIDNFEENKRLMKEAFEEQKTRDREMIEEQKAKDKEMVEEQKAKDRENLDSVKGQGKEDIDSQSEKNRENIDNIKSDNKNATDDARNALDQIKNTR